MASLSALEREAQDGSAKGEPILTNFRHTKLFRHFWKIVCSLFFEL